MRLTHYVLPFLLLLPSSVSGDPVAGPPSPAPEQDAEAAAVKRYEDCINRMIDEDQPSDSWLKTCLEGGKSAGKKAHPDKKPQKKALTLKEIETVAAAGVQDLGKCYQRLLQRGRDLALKPEGVFAPVAVITPSGSVAAVTFAPASLNDVDMLQCVKKNIAGWIFPSFIGKNNVTVKFQYSAEVVGAEKGRVSAVKGFPSLVPDPQK